MTTSTPFRFGVVAAPARTGTAWTDHVRHVERLGFDTLVAPDRIDQAALAASGAVSVVTGSPQQMADQLRERRERLGISYFVVSEELMDAFTPVLRILSAE